MQQSVPTERTRRDPTINRPTVGYPKRLLPAAPEQRATRVVFFIAGFAMSAWAPLVPFAKLRLDVDEAGLGLLLLCLGVGSIVTMPLSGALASRYGCRNVIGIASLCICGALPALATAATVPLLAVALFVFGACLGAIDVAANIQAVIVEQASGRAMMSGFHGLFSAGGIAGAASLSLLLWAGASPLTGTVSVAGVIVLLLITFGRHLLPYGNHGDTRHFALPRGAVLIIGGLCFIAFLSEGAMLDWSAVFLTSLRDVSPARAGMGYAVFSVAMTIGRLGGDRLVQASGGPAILVLGGICAASGLGLAILIPLPIGWLAGFAMVGLGASNIVPLLYSALGRQAAMPPNLAVAAVTTLGYLGILIGPALIGLIAHVTGLATALLAVAAMMLLIPASARIARRPV